MFSNYDGISSNSYNNDVLQAEPVSIEAKEKLVEELKNRAKGSISTRNFPAAIQLYTKAIEVIPSENINSSSILYANRSMCYLSMGNHSLALDDANKSESLDPTYVKAYYRKASALKALCKYSNAKEAVLKGLSLKSHDKDLKTLLAKIEEDLKSPVENGSHGSAEKVTVKPARVTVTTNGTKATTTTTTTSKPVTKEEKSEDGDDIDEDVMNLNMRGYKKTSDGRVTTFFNNELDENAKKLIGDIAPKKLCDPTSAILSPTMTENGSVWNSAGTYEERILTPWASNFIKENISNITNKIEKDNIINKESVLASSITPITSITISTTEVENLVGDAQVSMIRGKKKYLCDYCFDVKWNLTISYQTGEDDIVTGKLSVLDMTADKEYEINNIEVSHFKNIATNASNLPKHIAQLFNSYIKNTSTSQICLNKIIHNVIHNFCNEFKTK